MSMFGKVFSSLHAGQRSFLVTHSPRPSDPQLIIYKLYQTYTKPNYLSEHFEETLYFKEQLGRNTEHL